MTCRIIGTGAMAAVGLYALDMTREHKPGSVVGKRIMGGVGVCEYFIGVLSSHTVAHMV
jgi:hypothetical protein